MGCWNKTCGLTNLPIICGEQTYVFVLERAKEIHDHCYSTHLYRPLLLPFVSTYNDYGGGEDSNGVAFAAIMDGIKKYLVEMPVGENQYHDIAISRDEWGEELFFDAVHEHRLRINYYHHGEVETDFVMMRKDVVDDLAESYEFEEYLGEGKGTCGYKNCYTRYRFVDVANDVDAFLDATLRIMKEQEWRWPRVDMIAYQFLESEGVQNRVAKWLRHDSSYRFSNIVPAREYIMELLMSGDRNAARELMIEHLKGMFVNTFMEMTRKSWIPGSQEGSQRQEYEPYRALMTSMKRTMDERDARYAAEDGGYDV